MRSPHWFERDNTRPPRLLNRWFARGYDVLMSPLEFIFLRRVRADLARRVSGDVLEIGAGTGAMFAHYDESCRVIAAEPDPVMRERARRRIKSGSSRVRASIQLIGDPLEDLAAVPDRSVDFVLSSLVFCSVANLANGLRELKRVLRPSGSVVLLEHVNSRNRFLQRTFELSNVLWTPLMGGCRLGQQTQQAFREAGFSIEEEEFLLDFVVRFTARPAESGLPARAATRSRSA